MKEADTVLEMSTTKEAVRYLERIQKIKPFRCPYLLVAKEDMKKGKEEFQKGALLCSCGFLTECVLFERAVTDDEGRIRAQCRKPNGGIEVVFRRE